MSKNGGAHGQWSADVMMMIAQRHGSPIPLAQLPKGMEPMIIIGYLKSISGRFADGLGPITDALVAASFPSCLPRAIHGGE